MPQQQPKLSAEQQQMLNEQKKNCPFCKIAKGEIESKKVYEDDLFIAVLDINPAAKGHMLVMPKEHYPIMPIIPTETLDKLYILIKDIANAVYEGLLMHSTIFIANGAAAGQQSNHFLMHIIPREDNDSLDNFNVPENELSKNDVEKASIHLKNSLAAIMRRTASASAGTTIMQKTFSKEQLIGIIESNPPLKKIIIEQPEQFKRLAASHPQLGPMFEGKDVNEIVDEILERAGVKKEEKKLEKEVEKEEKEKSWEKEKSGKKENAAKKPAKEGKEGKANLDEIAGLFK